MRLLVLYHAGFTYTPTIRQYLEAIARHSCADVSYFNVDQPGPVDVAYFDAVFVNFCVASVARLEEKPKFWPPLVAALARFTGTTIVSIQDEYDFTDRVKEFLHQIRATAVLTNVPPHGIKRVYGEPYFANVRFRTVRTAYLADPEQVGTPTRLADRPILLGYRGRELPYRLGDLGWHKAEVGRQFQWACARLNLPCDIAVTEEARFQGDAWLRFVASCQVMLGTPTGANVFDFDGSLHRSMLAQYRANPRLRYEEVRDAVAAQEIGFDMGQVSARIFEAVSAGTALALVRGSYCGVLEPDEHYLPIEPDYSNVDDVIDRIRDTPAMQAMADRAWFHVKQDPANWYDTLVGMIDDQARADGIPLSGTGPLMLAVTDQPLGTDSYLIERLADARRFQFAAENRLREFIREAAAGRLEVTVNPDGSYQVIRH